MPKLLRAANARLRQALRDYYERPVPEALRDRLTADVERHVIRAEPDGQPHGAAMDTDGVAGPFRASTRSLGTPLSVIAIATTLAVACAVGVWLSSPSRSDVVAQTLKAMSRAGNVHLAGTTGDAEFEIWFSAEYGIRIEHGLGITVATGEATWEYQAEDNVVRIFDPAADRVSALPDELTGAYWLQAARDRIGEAGRTVTDVELDGRPAKRLDLDFGVNAEDFQVGSTAWVDVETKRVMQTESWMMRDGRRVARARTRFAYDVRMTADMFVFEPPAGARVVDCRLGEPLKELLRGAEEVARTSLVHEFWQEARAYGGGVRQFHELEEKEVWCQKGVGFRDIRADGWTRIGDADGEWRYQGSGEWALFPYRRDNDRTEPAACRWLYYMQRGGFHRFEGEPEVTVDEDEAGRRIARVVAYSVDDSGPGGAMERQKRVFTFDLGTRRLIRRDFYLPRGGEWNLAISTRMEYVEEAPEGLFDPAVSIGFGETRD